jgi:hypothetical protein
MVLSYLHQNQNEQRFQERHAGANDQQSLPGLETLLRNVPPASHHNTLLVRLYPEGIAYTAILGPLFWQARDRDRDRFPEIRREEKQYHHYTSATADTGVQLIPGGQLGSADADRRHGNRIPHDAHVRVGPTSS